MGLKKRGPEGVDTEREKGEPRTKSEGEEVGNWSRFYPDQVQFQRKKKRGGWQRAWV